MLFPGAVYIIGFILAVVVIAFSVACGFAGGLVVRYFAMKAIRSTKTWQKVVKGYVMKRPWWTEWDVWFIYFWVLCSIMVAYALFGVWWYTICLLK